MNKFIEFIEENKITVVITAITLTLGAGAGYWLGVRSPSESVPTASVTEDKKVLFYRNPMNPAITSPVPAKDEMGMEYIPVYADDGGDQTEVVGTVKIDPVTVQNIGVRIAIAEKRTLSRSVRAVGRVEFDETRLTQLHPKISGWVEKLYVAKTGQYVKKDTILLGIYSPQLVTSQQEYILALKNKEMLANSPFEDVRKGAEELLKGTRERLELLDVAEHQIKELEETRKVKKSLHIHSPYTGVVIKVGAREGQHVTPKTRLYVLADLSRVWVYADIYDYELPWIKLGDRAHMQLTSAPGKTFRGRVTYIYPYAETKTRTIKVRLEFANTKGLLKPDMFADVTINASRRVNAIVIPSEAVVRSGTREQVFVVRGPGKFEPREIKLGITSDGYTQVLEGLAAGDKVVSSAQFLIDSESKLREATSKMLEAAKTTLVQDKETGPTQTDMKQNMDHSPRKNKKHKQEMKCGQGMKPGQEMKHD